MFGSAYNTESMKEEIGVTPADEMVKHIRSKNILDILDGGHTDKYHAWLIDGTFTGLRSPSLVLAVFPTASGGFDLEFAEAINNGERAKSLQKLKQLSTSPGLEYVEEMQYGELVILGDLFLQAFGEQVLSESHMPSSMVIFEGSASVESVCLLCPKNIPPSVALRQMQTQAGYSRRNGHTKL